MHLELTRLSGYGHNTIHLRSQIKISGHWDFKIHPVNLLQSNDILVPAGLFDYLFLRYEAQPLCRAGLEFYRAVKRIN